MSKSIILFAQEYLRYLVYKLSLEFGQFFRLTRYRQTICMLFLLG